MGSTSAPIRNLAKAVRPYHIGFALYFAFSFLYLHDIMPQTGKAGLPGIAPACYLAVFFAARIVVFNLCALAAYRRPSLSATSTLSLCAALLLVIGLALSTIILRVGGFEFGASESTLMLAVAACLLGAGDALMLLVWGRFCGTLSLRSVYVFVLLSYLASLVVYALFVELPPLAILAIAAVGIAAIPFLLKKSMAGRAIETAEPTNATLRNAVSLLWRPVFITATFAFVSNLTLFVSGQQSVDVEAAQWTSTAVTLLVVIAMLLPALLFPKRVDIGSAYRIALPIAAGGFLLLAFIWNTGGGVANSMVAMGWLITDVITWCIIANVVYTTKLPALILFGACEAATSLASLLGVGIGYTFAGFIETGSIAIMALALVAVYLLSTVVLFVLKDRSIAGYTAERSGETDALPKMEDATTTQRAAADDLFEQRCRALAEQAQLTPRESDMLRCLAQGRSTQYMAERFTLSENTVKSHVRNVYQKLGVHSKQDVIDIVHKDPKA
ncbi:helix-turn-helix transcriptional regulator [Raoultibacter phocaeensis]|uniref:helix-turn-helix transcriptional regulator n=1 Tax=Raoultibacter phocaeensis TaxID=2479841 RepID=UPI001119A031|nr:LuxR family transcriptional regulator [Raoultibacter phocaeensis]